MGFPFALKINEVTPITEAVRVIYFSLSNIINEMTMVNIEENHKMISLFEKYESVNLIFTIATSAKNKHPSTHLLRPNDV